VFDLPAPVMKHTYLLCDTFAHTIPHIRGSLVRMEELACSVWSCSSLEFCLMVCAFSLPLFIPVKWLRCTLFVSTSFCSVTCFLLYVWRFFFESCRSLSDSLSVLFMAVCVVVCDSVCVWVGVCEGLCLGVCACEVWCVGVWVCGCFFPAFFCMHDCGRV